MQSEREAVPDINIRENIVEMVREVQNFPLIELPLASGCCKCRCGNLCMRKINTLTMIRGFNLLNQETLLNVWIGTTG